MSQTEFNQACEGYMERIGAKSGRLPLIDKDDALAVFDRARAQGLIH